MAPLIVITGVTISLLLTSVGALNSTQDDAGFYPPIAKALYPDVTFTTPPDIPRLRDHPPYEREYGEPAEEYGVPARGYGTPYRSSYSPYPPAIPTGYGPPTGFGQPPPGAFPPTGGLPPPGVALPSGGFASNDMSSEAIKYRLYVLFEPVAVLVVGVTIFVGIRHYVLPYLIYWARSLEEEELLLEDGRALDGPTTLNILKAVTGGVCLSRISCRLGMMARDYTIKDLVLSAIEDDKSPPRLAVIFRDTAMGRVESCAPYICRRKRLPSSSDPESKHWRRKLNAAEAMTHNNLL